jgi:hypothetical protein
MATIGKMQTPRIRTPPAELVRRLLSDPPEGHGKAFKNGKRSARTTLFFRS